MRGRLVAVGALLLAVVAPAAADHETVQAPHVAVECSTPAGGHEDFVCDVAAPGATFTQCGVLFVEPQGVRGEWVGCDAASAETQFGANASTGKCGVLAENWLYVGGTFVCSGDAAAPNASASVPACDARVFWFVAFGGETLSCSARAGGTAVDCSEGAFFFLGVDSLAPLDCGASVDGVARAKVSAPETLSLPVCVLVVVEGGVPAVSGCVPAVA